MHSLTAETAQVLADHKRSALPTSHSHAGGPEAVRIFYGSLGDNRET